MTTYGGMEVNLHTFLTSNLDGSFDLVAHKKMLIDQVSSDSNFSE
jgi:hypothetical protein